MRTIPISGKRDAGVFAIVDDADYATIAASRWYRNSGGYLWRASGSRAARDRTTQLMHRVVLGLVPGDGLEADHYNGDKLDNRRCNLRVCTRALNQQNRPTPRRSTSSFRGVYWSKTRSAWIAQGRTNGHALYLGMFSDELAAARAAQQFRLEHMPFAVESVIL